LNACVAENKSTTHDFMVSQGDGLKVDKFDEPQIHQYTCSLSNLTGGEQVYAMPKTAGNHQSLLEALHGASSASLCAE
jgi:catabolite regulation protein CreA